MSRVDYPVYGAMMSWNLQDTDLYAARAAFGGVTSGVALGVALSCLPLPGQRLMA